MRAESVLVARRDIPRQDSLPLVLLHCLLVKIVWDLNPIPGHEEIEMKRIAAIRQKIQPIEERLVVSYVVIRQKLRRIQKAAAANAVHGEKVSEFRSSPAEAKIASRRSEGAVVGIHVAEESRGPQPGSGRDIRNQAGLVSELCLRCPGDHLHTLNRADRKLRRKHLTLLVANVFSIDDKADLRVITEGVKKSVSISGHSARAIDDRLAQACAGVQRWKLEQRGTICVDVSGGIDFQRLRNTAFYVHAGSRSCKCQRRFNLNRNRVPNVDILRKRSEPGSEHLKMIRIVRNVADAERPMRVRCRLLLMAGERVMKTHNCACHGCPGWINYSSLDGSCIPQ